MQHEMIIKSGQINPTNALKHGAAGLEGVQFGREPMQQEQQLVQENGRGSTDAQVQEFNTSTQQCVQ
jgi:hypothetical protein